MKRILRMLFVLVILSSILLSACAPPPPPVTKDQLDTAENETLAEEKKANDLQNEMNALEAELSAKEAEYESLIKYQNELEAGK
jgi:outer membrane murein-binding lipoprotein Lpp